MRRRIIISLGLLLCLCLLGDAIAMYSLNSSISQLSGVAQSHRIQSMRAELVSSGVRMERDLLAHLAGHDLDSKQRSDSVERFETSVDRCTRCHHEPPVQAELDEMYQTFAAYQAGAERLFETTDVKDRAVLEVWAMQLAHRLVEETTRMADRAGSHMVVQGVDAAAGIHSAWKILTVTLVAVLIAGGIIAFHLERRLTVPVADLLAGIDRIRDGDMAHRLAIHGDEEFRALGNALNHAYTNLQAAHDSVLQAEKLATAGRLAAGVAHEVGNPLASISSIAQMMLRKPSSPQQAEQIDLIMQEVARISRIVRELLTFSRPGRVREHGPVDVEAMLRHSTNLLEYDKRAENVKITCTPEPSLPAVHGSEDRLLLVFTNILINALDAISADNGRSGAVDIMATTRDGSVVVEFADTGPGMSKEQVAEAFEPFFTTKDPGVGTGLGLWVCYQVVREHDGSIEINSTPGSGTAVTVTLPVGNGETTLELVEQLAEDPRR